MTPRKALVGAGAAIIALGVAAGLAGAAGLQLEGAMVRGPHEVRPGQRVTFRLIGMSPRLRVGVVAQPWSCRDSNGCGVAIGRHRRWRASGQGRIRLRFRWPRHYQRCAGAGHCHRYRWGRHRAAQITFCSQRNGEVLGCLRYKVRLRH